MAQKTTAKTHSPSSPKTKPAQKAAPSGQAAPAAKGAASANPRTAVVVTTKHLAATIAGRHEMSQKQADLLLTDLVALMIGHLKAGDRLRLNGLGILEVKDRPERQGRNPATGETIQIKASKKMTFRPVKELKEAI
jgi:DNA-binding protein HU-beta